MMNKWPIHWTETILFICLCIVSGQIELYTHLPVMKQLVEQLQQWEFRVCGVFLVDSQFMVESFKVKELFGC